MSRKYNMLVDVFTQQKSRAPKFKLETFFGQLQHLFCVRFVECPDLGIHGETTILLAAIRTCIITKNVLLEGLDMHDYSRFGSLHFVDIKNIQCLVARIVDRNQWTILDRSGSLAQATYTGDV
jgi:hypothetical protein